MPRCVSVTAILAAVPCQKDNDSGMNSSIIFVSLRALRKLTQNNVEPIENVLEYINFALKRFPMRLEIAPEYNLIGMRIEMKRFTLQLKMKKVTLPSLPVRYSLAIAGAARLARRGPGLAG